MVACLYRSRRRLPRAKRHAWHSQLPRAGELASRVRCIRCRSLWVFNIARQAPVPMGHIAAFESDFLSAIGMNTPPEFQRTFGETLAHLAQVAQRVPFAAFGPVAEKPVND